jgi:hypothetical protein
VRLPSLFCCLLLSLGCSPVPPPQSTPTPQATPTTVASAFKPGGVYSVVRGKEGGFTVVRVLVCEEGAVHARLYSNTYKERPVRVDPKTLKMAIGHVPLSEEGFRNWQPILLFEEPVRDEELEGYRMWKNR